MSTSNDEIRVFPETVYEALALEYVRQQDLSGKTPREVMRLYASAYKEIFDEQRAIWNEKKETRRQSEQ